MAIPISYCLPGYSSIAAPGVRVANPIPHMSQLSFIFSRSLKKDAHKFSLLAQCAVRVRGVKGYILSELIRGRSFVDIDSCPGMQWET